MRYFQFIVALLLFWIVSACQQNRNSYEMQLQFLQEESSALYCQKEELQKELEMMWKGVAQALDEDLPATLRPQERANIIALKNAGLIRMFEVYPQLDTAIHAMVDRAEVNDQRIAQELKSLQAKLQEKEQQVMALLEEVQQESQEDYLLWQEKFETAEQQPCSATTN